MSEISKAYEPQLVEEKWYEFWLKQGCFTADPARVSEKRPAYSIVIPPPNVTGVLTMGHVLNNTIQDILARKARMDGKEVLWLPGTDHAGIATQNVVEKTLRKEGVIKHRDDLGREALVAKIWDWKHKYGGIIIQQLKKLGASCDWSRERFTMDEEYSKCVQSVFVDLYKKGHIYRGKRMVNWCPASQTALSDEEVVMKEQKGFLYYFKVEVVEEPGTFLTIATTRPETIPGDTAIAVNPKDPRYARLVGKHARRPLPVENQAHLPIIGDEHVDFEFGTGVLKVTPAHDKADYEIFQRVHQWAIGASSASPFMWKLATMEPIEVIDAKGFMTEAAGNDLKGLERFKARKMAAEKLVELGLSVKEEPYTNNVGYSERADVPIEPRLSEQWFLKYPSVEKSRACVADGAMKFHPDRWAKVYDHWLGGIQDWCISRQLWWGHRVPVWYRGEDAVYCGVDAPEGEGWVQDPDVLDTWFSSWLWPFATMGWPENTETLKKFYPTTDLVTGPDIIFFWVARMIMAGYEYKGDLPFKNVYFTGIIRDKQGRKMSKSLGNSPDPLDLIAKYGADALRFGVMRAAPLGQDILFDEQNVELGRNFCNKLWNACRFRQMVGVADVPTEGEINPDLLTSDDKWILIRLDQAIREVTQAFTDYRFSDATTTLYRFFWSEYCDWYVEASKAAFYGEDAKLKANKLAVIDFILGNMLRLFHPFLPFITEELWHGMGYSKDLPEDRGGTTIMVATWPKALTEEEKTYFGLDETADKVAAAKYELVSIGRHLRRELKLDPAKKLKFVLKPAGELPTAEVEVLKLLLNAETIEVNSGYVPPKGTPSSGNALGELFLPTEGLIDFGAERERLTKELEKARAEITKVQDKLGNPSFAEKVPAKVLEEHKQRLADWQAKEKQILASLENLPPE
ncbi:MAG: valine--tRNA ligase [Verrucomicrobiota bacterium]